MPPSLTSAAAVLIEYGEPLEIREIDVPEPEPMAIIVRVEAATLCGTDAHMARGDYAAAGFSKIPLIMGHEVVGRVVQLGAGRSTDSLGRPLEEGDLIAWAYSWCGECYWCTIALQPTLCINARRYGWGPLSDFPHLTGGFAEYAYIMPRCKVTKVPLGVDPAVAASATCSLRTAIHGYDRVGGISTSETVIIQGSGAVGLYALAYAIASGANRTIVIGAPTNRLEIASAWGADVVLDVESTSPSERRTQILEITEGRGADLVAECAGTRAALQEGFDLLRPGGRYLVIGQSDPRPVELRGMDFNVKQLTVVGSLGADIPAYNKALEFLKRKRDAFDFTELLGDTYRLSSVTQALESIATGREIRPVIEPRV